MLRVSKCFLAMLVGVNVRVSAGGSVTVAVLLSVQLLASLRSTVCEPGPSDGKFFGDVAAANPPPSIWIWYGGVPPPKVARMLPSVSPLQLMPVGVNTSVSAGGSVTVADLLSGQLLASLTSTVCEPGPSDGKFFGDVAAANPPPSIWIWYGGVPPPKVAKMLPSANPLQLMFVGVNVSVTSDGWFTVAVLLSGQLWASLRSTVCEPGPSDGKFLGDVAATNPPP